MTCQKKLKPLCIGSAAQAGRQDWRRYLLRQTVRKTPGAEDRTVHPQEMLQATVPTIEEIQAKRLDSLLQK
jgi:hypothetical protein